MPSIISPPTIASNSTLAPIDKKQTGKVVERNGQLWFVIEEADEMGPFLMTMASDSDHWLFLSSNGAMTAGRVNPDKAIFPYYTQDKLEEMSESSGNRTLIRIPSEASGKLKNWQPFTRNSEWDSEVSRTIRKNIYGNHIELEETHQGMGLVLTVSWRPSGKFGFIRKTRVRNTSNRAIRLQILDGLQSILPAGLDQRFINEFSNLANAYKQAERDPADGLALYHLSSIPTDLAEPKESLLATSVWQVGMEGAKFLISDSQIKSFQKTGDVVDESYVRAKRGAYLMVKEFSLEPNEAAEWYICAEADQDTGKIEELKQLLKNRSNLVELVEKDCDETEKRLSQMLSKADGLQHTGDKCRTMRHTSNTLFNLMRGGAFLNEYAFPLDDLRQTIAHFNHEAITDLNDLLGDRDQLLCWEPWNMSDQMQSANPDLIRLLREYLPLSFSRRHGDPSRPWNRFSIEIRNPDGSPRYFYQGNWRDIFQNWEALVHSFPEYCEATVCRFLNSSTADGYNPYRLTKDGYDWEVVDPNDTWANIGYWGDHQIVYLLKLLEASVKFHPERLPSLLNEESFVYAEIPYRIRSYKDILTNPRETIDYDKEWEKRIADRSTRIGADGKLAHTKDGELLHVTLLEKLLAPLVAKLSNFIPDGGIWMNTQRPEWNDANNALVGYGVSVITLAYVSRYLKFILETFGEQFLGKSFRISRELAELIASQSAVFAASPESCTSKERKAIMDQLGSHASRFRENLYDSGLSGQKAEISGSELLTYFENALLHANNSLRANRRPDALWHSYNLIRYSEDNAEIDRLKVMLEGQVAILSAGLLEPNECLQLLEALRQSALYREDQNSYILYPDKDLPQFLDKNRITADKVNEIPSLKKMLESGDKRIATRLPSGDIAFNGNFHNGNDLKQVLDNSNLPLEDGLKIQDLFEKSFNHHAFTGRSGTFFAYEGLGSIYWHMVSKLALAVQENYLADSASITQTCKASLLQHYRAICDGLGIHKDPVEYGAFPTDAYSHTPAHAGAQQPGMTGQVKEDILLRLTELGIRIEKGCISFVNDMLDQSEYLTEEASYSIPQNGDGVRDISLPANSLAFSFCGTPILYRKDTSAEGITIHRFDGSTEVIGALKLNNVLSSEIFCRRGEIDFIQVDFTN